jgi:hypothetical protein
MKDITFVRVGYEEYKDERFRHGLELAGHQVDALASGLTAHIHEAFAHTRPATTG